MNYTKENKWEAHGNMVNVFGRGIICECPSPQNGGVLEFTANANLIAAAPEMYEALKKIRGEGTRCLDLVQQDKPVREVYKINEVDRIARQALAKADGGK